MKKAFLLAIVLVLSACSPSVETGKVKSTEEEAESIPETSENELAIKLENEYQIIPAKTVTLPNIKMKVAEGFVLKELDSGSDSMQKYHLYPENEERFTDYHASITIISRSFTPRAMSSDVRMYEYDLAKKITGMNPENFPVLQPANILSYYKIHLNKTSHTNQKEKNLHYVKKDIQGLEYEITFYIPLKEHAERTAKMFNMVGSISAEDGSMSPSQKIVHSGKSKKVQIGNEYSEIPLGPDGYLKATMPHGLVVEGDVVSYPKYDPYYLIFESLGKVEANELDAAIQKKTLQDIEDDPGHTEKLEDYKPVTLEQINNKNFDKVITYRNQSEGNQFYQNVIYIYMEGELIQATMSNNSAYDWDLTDKYFKLINSISF